MAHPRLRLEHVSKTFPGQKALDDVTLELAPGEIHALVGENGSGKSTMIKILSGFYSPDPGSRLEVDGAEVALSNSAASKRAGMRFVHQDLGLIDELTAAENIGLSSEFARKGPAIDWVAHRRRSRGLLRVMGVTLDVDRPVMALSAVERTAIAIARALDPDSGPISVLVLDEPTAALPPADVEILAGVLRRVRASGVSILYVSHRLGEVLDFADRITVLKDGRSPGTFSASNLDTKALAELIVGRPVQHEETPRAAGTGSAEGLFSFDGVRTATLAGAAFDVRRGEVLGFAGIAGSGREELARAIGAAIPAEGTVRSADSSPSPALLSEKVARALGIVLVVSNRSPDAAVLEFSVRENMTLPVVQQYKRQGRIRGSEELGQVRTWMDRLDVAPADPERTYGYLSGGNKQKVVMARGLMREPRLLVLDDPTSGVDVGARQAIYHHIRELAETGTPVVVCSADLEDLVGVCDRVLVVSHGVVTQELTGAAVSETDILAAIS